MEHFARIGPPPSSFAASFVLFVLTSLVVVPNLVSADDYSVQIGAFREAPPDYADAATEVGPLFLSQNREGLTRLQIGRFESKEAAQVALGALVGAGYSDAFVVQKVVTRNDAVRSPVAERDEPVGQVGDPLLGVPESLRSRVVILDGAYHVKEGDRFIPLDEALAELSSTPR